MVANFNHDSCWDPIQLFDDRKWRGLWSPIGVLLVSYWNFHQFWGFGDWPHFETPIFVKGVTGIIEHFMILRCPNWQIELLRYWQSSPYSSEVLPQWWGRSNQCLVWCLVLDTGQRMVVEVHYLHKAGMNETSENILRWFESELSNFGVQMLGFICVLHLCFSCFSVATLPLFKVILLIQRFKLEALKPSTRHSALPISVRFPIFVGQTKTTSLGKSLEITMTNYGGNFGNLQ